MKGDIRMIHTLAALRILRAKGMTEFSTYDVSRAYPPHTVHQSRIKALAAWLRMNQVDLGIKRTGRTTYDAGVPSNYFWLGRDVPTWTWRRAE